MQNVRAIRASRCGLLIVVLVISCQVSGMEVGDEAPSISLPALDGAGVIDLSNYRGKVVYLDFWASWCRPCRVSLPLLSRMRDQLVQGGFEVVAVDVDEDPQKGREFLARYPVSYPVANDSTGAAASRYRLLGMPSAFLIDKRGVVRAVHEGFKESDIHEIRERVLTLLAEDLPADLAEDRRVELPVGN